MSAHDQPPTSLRVGFDVAQTCVERAGCGWYADALARALPGALAPGDTLLLWHHFGDWQNPDTTPGTHLDLPNVREPLRGSSPAQVAAAWHGASGADAEILGRPNLVHANSFQAPRVPGAKLVFTVYDLSFWEVPEFTTERNRLVCQAGVLAALRHADGFVFISEHTRREFEHFLPGWLERSGRPWTVTPLAPRGVPPPEGRPDAAAIPEVAGPYWLSVGSLEPRKNHRTLLQALELYWERSPEPRPLVLAGGDGWRSEDLRAVLASPMANGRVRRLGYVPEERLGGLYAGATALLFPSWHEGFGLPMLEAMAAGCPVVCGDRTSLPEVAGDAAVLVNPASAEDLCVSMLALEADPAFRAALTAAGRARAAGYSWAGTARMTVDFYRRVLAGPAPGPPKKS